MQSGFCKKIVSDVQGSRELVGQEAMPAGRMLPHAVQKFSGSAKTGAEALVIQPTAVNRFASRKITQAPSLFLVRS